MIEISIPGYGDFSLEILVLDYNGTLALDGLMPVHLQDTLTCLAKLLEIHIITSDTFGSVATQCEGLPITIKILETKNHAKEKADYLTGFGERMVVAIGNGANDQMMLNKAHLGIAILGPEGASSATLMAADVIVKNINDALELLINPRRLVATLRL